MEQTLICPGCEAEYSSGERFCRECRLPLVHDRQTRESQGSPSESQRRARKIKPQYTEGELVKVAGARNQTEAEFIQGLLLEEGIPSLMRRSAGFEVPDFLAAGPRDVLVAQSAVQSAREMLLLSELATPAANLPGGPGSAIRVMAGLLVALVIVAIVILLHT